MGDATVVRPVQLGDVAQDASSAARLVKRPLLRLLALMPGNIERAAHLQRYLGIDSKLAWQVFKTANSENLLDAARHVPSRVSMQKFVKAALDKGLPRDLLEEIQAAVIAFDEVGARHGGDRAMFSGMVAAIQGDAATAFSQQRRSAFRANSQLWGCQTGTFFVAGIMNRNVDGTTDCAAVGAKAGLRRFRVDAMPPEFAASQRSSSGEILENQAAPIDNEALEVYGIPLLPRFCSQPIPHFRKARMFQGWCVYMVDNDQIGCTSAIDLVFSTHFPQVTPVKWSDGRTFCYQSLTFRQPTELAVLELIVNRRSFGEVRPQYRVIPDDGTDFVVALERSRQYFPTDERVVKMGTADEVSGFANVQRYAEITSHVMQKLNWDPTDFDVYRVKIPHPIMNTTAVLYATIE